MSASALVTLAVMLVLVIGLIRAPHLADVLFLGAVVVLTALSILTPAEAFAGFTNEGMLTIAALFVVAGGLVETGLIGTLSQRLLGAASGPYGALRRFVPPTVTLSAFLNNTTVVAMLMPGLLDWARRRRVAPSKLLLPLSYASILGGVCTLIGTSTNLVVHGLLRDSGLAGFGMWELAGVGLPIALIGGGLLVAFGPRLLPARKEFLESLGESRREFLVELEVMPECPLIGQSIEQAGLRHLAGLFLVEIERHDRRITPVGSTERIEVGDRLVFTGVVSTIVDLQRIPGLKPTVADDEALDPTKRGDLVEAVVSTSSPLVGRGIREANFRTTYNAAVIAVHRNGERLARKIGDIVLRPGDTLLMIAGAGFVRAQRNNPDFFLVSQAGEATPIRQRQARWAGAIAIAMVLGMTVPDLLGLFEHTAALAERIAERRVIIAFMAAGLMLATGCLSIQAARRSINWQVLVMIAAAIGLSRAMDRSGAAELLADWAMAPAERLGPIGVLATVYLLTWVLTEIMSNNAAAALMFPVAAAAAAHLGVDVRPLAVAVTIAASGGFVMPAGYQTHLMVFGPGGYRLGDFLRIGLPMAVIWFAIAMVAIPVFWPLR